MQKTRYEEKLFKDMRLRGTVLRRCEFVDCTFQNCVAEECTLAESSLIRCSFQGCRITNVKSESSFVKHAIFSSCTLSGINWQLLLPDGPFAEPVSSFAECRLRYHTFCNMRFWKFCFSGSEILHSTFAGCSLVESDFTSCRLDGTEFFKCDMRKADFRGAVGYRFDLLSCAMKGAKFSFPEAIRLLDSLKLDIDYPV